MSVEPTMMSSHTGTTSHLNRYHGRVGRDVDEFFLTGAGAPAGRSTTQTGQSSGAAQEQSLSFFDFLDVINPLQHIPVVNEIYREYTGDEISPQAQVMGGTLYGGPIGLVASAATMLFEQVTGDSPGGTMMAALGLKSDESEPGSVVASRSSDVSETSLEQSSPSVRPIQTAVAGSAAANSGETVFVMPASQGVTASADQVAALAPAAGHNTTSVPGRSAFMENLMRTRGVNTGATSLSAEQRVIAADALKATNVAPALMQNQARAAEQASQPAEDDIPTLSEGSMNAILNAFGQPTSANSRSQTQSAANTSKSGPSAGMPQPAADPFAKMQQALDQYQKMKAAQQTNVIKEQI